MKQFLRVAALSALLTGCAVVKTDGDVWYKEGAADKEQQAALGAAEAQAAQAASATPAQKRGIVVRNMTAQGWRLVSKNSAPTLKTESKRPLPPPDRPG